MLSMIMLVLTGQDIKLENPFIIVFFFSLAGEWTPADFNTELAIIDEEKYE